MRFNNRNVTLPEPLEEPYAGLKFTSTGNSTIRLQKHSSAPTVNLQYSLDSGLTWTQLNYSTLSLTDGQTVCIKGSNTTFATNASRYNYFVMTGSVAASGNIMSIIDDGACTTTIISNDYCFLGLFMNCTSLTSAPELPATTLTYCCYQTMFKGCTSLTTAPVLSATTLAQACYAFMFSGCTSLTSAPELPAATLAVECYYCMFLSCTNLNYIKCLATNISAYNCTPSWVNGVSATGTFVKAASMTGWTTGAYGIPSGWTVQDAA